MHERIIQSAIIAYLRRVLPDALVHHSPNEGVRGGKSGLIDGRRRKDAGQVAGWPDIEVLLPSCAGPLFFEVKTATGKTSKAQDKTLAALQSLGYRVSVVQSIDDCRRCLYEWGIPTRESGSLVRLELRGVVS